MLKYYIYRKIMMRYMLYQPNNFVITFNHKMILKMKNLKTQLSILYLLLLVNLTKADNFIDLKIISSNNHSFIIQLSDIKYDTKCLLLNQRGEILYKENIANTDGTILSYIDEDVVNSTTYFYYVTAVYPSGGASSPTNIVSATPVEWVELWMDDGASLSGQMLSLIHI